MFENMNLLDMAVLPSKPTELLCKLIRKLYQPDEIAAGIKNDNRLTKIKGDDCS
jgi:hypothetical protein